MAATITIRVYTGAAPGVMSSAVTAMDLCSIDTDVSSPANRTSNPISAGGRSYEKWVVAYVDVAPDNWVNNFQIWGDGEVQDLTDLFYGFTAVYVQPVATDSVVAINDFTAAISTAKAQWHTSAGGQANLVNIGDMTRFLVFQLDVDAAHPGGSWTQEIVEYQYEEA